MRLIDRYIFRTVIGTALIALLVMLILETFIALLTELEHLGVGNYDLGEVLRFLGLTLPRRAYETFPMALLVGGLLGMGSLASGSELIVMRAAGLSLLRMVWAALKAGLVLSLLAVILGEFIAPHAEKAAVYYRSLAKDQQVIIRGGRGFWARDGGNFVNVRSVQPGIRLGDVYIYEIDDKSNLKSVTWAQGARYVNGHWVLDGVRRSYLETGRVATDSPVQLSVDSVISPDMLEVLASDPQDLSMRDLRTYIRYLTKNGLDASGYQLAFWAKVVGPLTNLAMLFIAMPFVFGSQRTASAGQRLLIGVVLGLVFFLANRMLGNVVLLYGYPPVIGAGLPTLLFFASGTYALHRMR